MALAYEVSGFVVDPAGFVPHGRVIRADSEGMRGQGRCQRRGNAPCREKNGIRWDGCEALYLVPKGSSGATWRVPN